ncbi:MAG: hypothetical protein ACIARR_06325 [Phycisphaerales bacterium JB059]
MPAPPAPPPPSATSAPPTRERLLELGQGDHPRAFLEPAARALDLAPADAGVRFLFARALTDLALTTLAREQLDRLPRAAADLPEVAHLRARLHDAPVRLDHHADRRERLTDALDALAARGHDLRAHLDAWAARDRAREHHLTNDHDLISRSAGEPDPLAWRWLTDWGAHAERLVGQALAGAPTPPLVTLVGASPPHALLALRGRSPDTGHDHTPWIPLIEPDPLCLLDALAHPAGGPIAHDERVIPFLGERATLEFEAWARARFEGEALAEVIVLPTLEAPLSPDPRVVAERIRADQRAELARAHRVVTERYAPRDPAWWRDRYARALTPGSDEPLRVLIPTHRHSTYVRHASSDLAGAFERLGARTLLLTEPDDHTRLSNVAYLHAFERFEPDLVVLINYPRPSRTGEYPQNVPFVCWIQDEMPHLFDPRVGRGQGSLDFLCGHLYPRLFTEHEYPRARLLSVPVVADSHKFHPAPVTDAQRARFACEVAFVSHHSETPDALRERLIAEVADPDLEPVLREIDADSRRRLESPETTSFNGDTARFALDALTRAASDAVARALLPQYVAPLRERLIRHQTIRWTHDICARRGWRFKLFGRGWESHPEFATLAAGELEHGDDLRACYQCAALHLHATAHGVVHQRVMECALSGGLPACRLTHDTLLQNTWLAQIQLQESATPVARKPGSNRPIYSVADHPDTMLHTRERQLLGLPAGPTIVARTPPEQMRSTLGPVIEAGLTPRWLLGDLGETGFTTPAQLERLIELAVERPERRRRLSDAIAARVRARTTHDALAGRLLDLIRDAFA